VRLTQESAYLDVLDRLSLILTGNAEGNPEAVQEDGTWHRLSVGYRAFKLSLLWLWLNVEGNRLRRSG